MIFQHSEVDHVIPLDAIKTPEHAERVRARYVLPSTFDFDWFENWVPSCRGCNGKKRFMLIDPSPDFGLNLASVGARATLAKATADAIDTNSRKARLLAQVEAAVEQGSLTEEYIRGLLEGLPRLVKKAAPDVFGFQEQEVLNIAPGWSVIQSSGYLRIVSDGRRAGMTSTSNEICHGTAEGDKSASPVAKGENPSPPQLATDGVEDDPEGRDVLESKTRHPLDRHARVKR